jgi:two-component system chemotaxis sensor kinase CheA
MSDELAIDASLLPDYLTECEELLQQLDQDLVALEAAPNDTELLNRVFRAFHTIKGTSGFMGFTWVVELTHHAEDVLNLLRKGARKVTRGTMDVLLAALDQLRRMILDLRKQRPPSYELGDLLGKLRALQSPEPSVTPEGPRLGEILLVEQVVKRSEIEESLQEAQASHKRIGEVLVEKGLVSPRQVKEALEQQRMPAKMQEGAHTIRVEVGKIDELINLTGELVLERNRLTHLSRNFAQQRISSEKLESALAQTATRLSFLTDELQGAGLRTRMVPVDTVFRRIPRLVRDLSMSLGKEAELAVRGEDTELDKTVVEEISDPLVHLIRNSLDHGIEAPAVREVQGKPRKGTIRLEARQEGDHIVILVGDDGAGIDPQRIGRKAIEKGLVTAERLRAMSRSEILGMIFLPGFSTAEQLSDVSGRGVGMDVVRSNLKKLNGVVELESEVGTGSTFRLRLPLTLAILPVLLVKAAGETYALPLRAVIETMRVRSSEVHRVDGSEMLQLRDRVLPVLRLKEIFGLQRGAADQDELLRIVVLGVGEKRVGMVVEQLLGQEDTVIKPLGSYLGHLAGVAGGTIGGDGLVRLILDPAGLLGMSEAQRAPAN